MCTTAATQGTLCEPHHTRRLSNLPSSLQFTELLLLRDEFRDICEWLCVCECDGLESVERTEFEGRIRLAAIGLGVTVTMGCTEPVWADRKQQI